MTALFRYNDLLKTKYIEVLPEQQGGYKASVSFLGADGKVTRVVEQLPLLGIPAELSGQGSMKKLCSYLNNTYLIPEKGIDGNISRVSVRVAYRGGGFPKIPFQPGLALGSVVSGDVLNKMQAYADAKAINDRFEDQIKSAEQEIERLDTKIASRQEKGNEDCLVKLWTAQKEKVTTYIFQLSEKVMNMQQNEIPYIESFPQGVVSPIDNRTSIIEIQPRSFDSENYSSQYILIDTKEENIQDKINQSSSTSNAFVGGGHVLYGSGEFNRTKSDAVLQRILQIKKEGKAEGVLIINAFVTTRNVRCFTKINYDLDKLRQVLAVMEGSNDAEKKRYGINKQGDSHAIFLLTEAVLGGSFTALVTFLDESKANRRVENEQNEKSSSTSASFNTNVWLVKASAGYTGGGSSSSKTEEDVLSSIAQTRVAIEFFSQGAIPAFSRNIIEREVLKHVNLDPSKYELSSSDTSNIEKIVKGKGQEQQIAILQQDMKIKNAQVAILNAFRGMTSEKQTQNVHTMESVMDAYENFAEQITNDKESGVPIGFNYTVLTQEEIKKRIVELEASFKQGSSSSAEGSKKQQGSSSSAEGSKKQQGSSSSVEGSKKQ